MQSAIVGAARFLCGREDWMALVDYDEQYRTTKDLFGSAPENILREHVALIPREHRVLDIGAGQGRNALFLARQGFEVDAIDPSAVAMDTIRTLVESESLPVHLYVCGFDDFAPEVDSYSAILIFGLIQILSRDSIDALVKFVQCRLHPRGLLFVAAFTTADASFATRARDCRAIGPNSFIDDQGHVRTYLESEELLTLFADLEAVDYWEGLGQEHRHGDGPVQRHEMVEAVMRRR